MACGTTMIRARWIFISIITLSCALCMFLTMKPKYSTPLARTSVFFCLAVSFLAPLIFGCIYFNPENSLPPDFGHLFLVAGIYAVGIFFYISKYPERLSKNGKFDYIGSSHNIWHVFILVALSLDITYCWQLYKRRKLFICPTPT